MLVDSVENMLADRNLTLRGIQPYKANLIIIIFIFSVYPFLGVVPEDVEMVKVQSYNDYSFHKNT
jgi:hypothetical protein